MYIEGRRNLGGAVSVRGPALNQGIRSFGVRLEAPSQLPGLDRKPSFSLKNTMPYTIGEQDLPKGGGRFSVVDVFREAESILASAAQPKIPEVFQLGLSGVNLNPNIGEPTDKKATKPIVKQQVFLPQPEPRPIFEPIMPQPNPNIIPGLNFLAIPFLKPLVDQPQPTIEPAVYTASIPHAKNEIKAAIHSAVEEKDPKAIYRKIGLEIEEQLEEVEEEVLEVRTKAGVEDREVEEIKEIKVQRIADEAVIKRRVEEIFEAAKKVREEKEDGEIDGQKVAKKLPGQHTENRSGELNKVDPKGYLFDGSLLATIKKLASRKFTSLIEVYKSAPGIVLEDIPVTRGEGQAVSDKDVAKVYAAHKGKVPPAQEVIKRVVKKLVKQIKKAPQQVQIIPVEKFVEKNEGRIEDYPEFAAVFK